MADEDTIVVAAPQHHKRSYHIWTHEQRVCVYLLSHEFQHLDITARAKVFNKIFETKLAASTIPHPGLVPDTIHQEYWKSKAPGTNVRHPWKDVYYPPNTVEEHTMRGSMRARISSVLPSSGTEDTPVESAGIRSSGNLTARSTPSEQNCTEMRTTEKRKRHATILMTPPSTAGEDSEDEDEFDRHFSPRKTSRHSYQRRGSPVVLVPSSTEASDSCDLVDTNETLTRSIHSPESPKALRRSIKPVTTASHLAVQRGSRVVSQARSEMLPRRNMKPIAVTVEKSRAAEAPFRDIPPEEAHPSLPRFLFRAFTAESQGLNSANGFVCGRYAIARVVPPGPPESPDMNDILEHLDPSKTPLKCRDKTLHQKMSSPYISFSSDLVWVIRKMIAQGEKSNVGIVDTSTLDPLSVFYIPPYQQELARKHLFHGREHRYKGYSEHLVYHEVPGSAIVKIFSYQELIAFAETDGPTREALRLPELRCSGASSVDVLKAMKQNKLRITPRVAIVIAKFVMFLGMDSSASVSEIAFLVCEIVRGWALRIAETTTAERSESTDRFMDAFYRNSDRVLSPKDQIYLKYA
jgi:hypothetical protein